MVTATDLRTSRWTWTLNRRRAWSGGIARYEGVDPSHPVDTAVSVASSSSPRSRLVLPGMSTTTSGAMLIASVGAAAARAAVAPPHGWTVSWEAVRRPTSEHAHRVHGEAGAITGQAWRSSSARPLAGWMAALRPATGSAQTPSPPPDVAPEASFAVSPTLGTPPLAVALADTSTGGPTSWSWDFGDGTTSAVQNPTHTYTAVGTYTVSLRVRNASGSDTASRVGAVTVEPPDPPPPPAPTASFTVSRATGVAPLTTTFTDTSAGAPTGWAWDFGDGTTDTTENPSHTYAGPGTYTVSLSATNASGSDTATRVGAVVVDPVGSNVLVGAGDIADCTVSEDRTTAELVARTPGTVFTLGDNAYPRGSTANYADCYDPTWGIAKSRTRPVVGNHEYETTDAAACYAYFGAAAGDPDEGWYSYDIGTDWHVVVLNSNCASVGGCAAGSPQHQWLLADLAASHRPCTVAMWHHPRYSSGIYGQDESTAPFWEALYNDGAELVLNGHEHDYERFAPQDSQGGLDPTYGIREFVVGTGGSPLRGFDAVVPHSELRSDTSHGVLELTLDDGSYAWQFLPIPGSLLDDSGTGSCHGAPGPP